MSKRDPVKEVEHAAQEMYEAMETYLRAVTHLASVHGKNTLAKVKPHVLRIAKAADTFHKHKSRGKK